MSKNDGVAEISLRDYFAAAALDTFLEIYLTGGELGNLGQRCRLAVADAYICADAMLAERERDSK